MSTFIDATQGEAREATKILTRQCPLGILQTNLKIIIEKLFQICKKYFIKKVNFKLWKKNNQNSKSKCICSLLLIAFTIYHDNGISFRETYNNINKPYYGNIFNNTVLLYHIILTISVFLPFYIIVIKQKIQV